MHSFCPDGDDDNPLGPVMTEKIRNMTDGEFSEYMGSFKPARDPRYPEEFNHQLAYLNPVFRLKAQSFLSASEADSLKLPSPLPESDAYQVRAFGHDIDSAPPLDSPILLYVNFPKKIARKLSPGDEVVYLGFIEASADPVPVRRHFRFGKYPVRLEVPAGIPALYLPPEYPRFTGDLQALRDDFLIMGYVPLGPALYEDGPFTDREYALLNALHQVLLPQGCRLRMKSPTHFEVVGLDEPVREA